MTASSSSLFSWWQEKNHVPPLAEALRPKSIEDYLGQEAVFGKGKPLRNLLDARQITSLILWGPPGVGKTTLSRIIAQNAKASFIELSAVHSGLKELREALAAAERHQLETGESTVVFIDEIHRYSKTQQDALLPAVEKGKIVLIGATTENPSFQVISALLSRLLVIQLSALSRDSVQTLIERGLKHLETQGNKGQDSSSSRAVSQSISIHPDAMAFLLDYANGDGRSALTLLEIAYKVSGVATASDQEATKNQITVELLEQLAQQGQLHYDKDGDAHYDHSSAYQKSMRGGDANAAIYWLAKMIACGEDPRFIARRLIVTATEDVGLAAPMALILANAAAEAVDRIGLPEARIALAQATIYIAKAKKSNLAICAIDQALQDIKHKGQNHPVPTHLRDSHYAGAKDYGHGVGYVYTHASPNQPQSFLPEALIQHLSNTGPYVPEETP
ncbi:MAG: replication-associated recombination protein A [Cyanobacteria bacterium]|nr:replication-associated recombination protein A [Cyanobacteriota bacterium]